MKNGNISVEMAEINKRAVVSEHGVAGPWSSQPMRPIAAPFCATITPNCGQEELHSLNCHTCYYLCLTHLHALSTPPVRPHPCQVCLKLLKEHAPAGKEEDEEEGEDEGGLA